MGKAGLTGHIKRCTRGLAGWCFDRLIAFNNALWLLLFRCCRLFDLCFMGGVEGLTRSRVTESPYPEQNRFDWLRLPSLQTNRPSDVQCAIPPFEPEQGFLPRAASAWVVNKMPESKRRINFFISISVLYFVIRGSVPCQLLTDSPENTQWLTDR